jgi:hypothetical protein
MKDQAASVVLSVPRRIAMVIGATQYPRRGWHQSRQAGLLCHLTAGAVQMGIRRPLWGIWQFFWWDALAAERAPADHVKR